LFAQEKMFGPRTLLTWVYTKRFNIFSQLAFLCPPSQEQCDPLVNKSLGVYARVDEEKKVAACATTRKGIIQFTVIIEADLLLFFATSGLNYLRDKKSATAA
jgi:hypothetical protein